GEGRLGRRLRLGMVGGGQGAFIGAVHRIAARLDDRYELVAGALSSDLERAKASAAELKIAPERAYASFEEMAKREAARDDGIDVVAIVTPNHLHHPVAKAFLEAGIHVICDKPMTTTVEDALDLVETVRRTGLVFVLTHNYTGHPMVREARERVSAGELGTIRVVQVEYPQDWLTTKLEDSGQKQAAWRTDPAQSGAGGAIGDIGSHAYNLAGFITGLEAESLCADLSTFVAGRRVDDNCNVLLRYKGGARGMLWACQVAPGNENALRVRVYGDRGGLAWEQERPDVLHLFPFGQPPQTITRMGHGAGPAAAAVSRIPPGHVEGYLEAFANIYTGCAELITARLEGREPDPAARLVPSVEDGARGVRFITAAVESSSRGAVWTELDLAL
ncbi:MAG TPA: Gfo/Idh/MocA family oxidoreductase, partial [Geminicoccaceae bacterium]|nr:Gfo/Idh/MocA family oxidoreductase [Geminicoccaceae bacterium]